LVTARSVTTRSLAIVPGLVVQMVTTGLAEEPGRRDFALPYRQPKFGPLRGTLILGPPWGLWQLPLFFSEFAFHCGSSWLSRNDRYFAIVFSSSRGSTAPSHSSAKSPNRVSPSRGSSHRFRRIKVAVGQSTDSRKQESEPSTNYTATHDIRT
jgi:hypothetical protein